MVLKVIGAGIAISRVQLRYPAGSQVNAEAKRACSVAIDGVGKDGIPYRVISADNNPARSIAGDDVRGRRVGSSDFISGAPKGYPDIIPDNQVPLDLVPRRSSTRDDDSISKQTAIAKV